jgi:hypothetical protein
LRFTVVPIELVFPCLPLLLKEIPELMALELAKRPDFHRGFCLEIFDEQEEKQQDNVVAS